MEYYENNFEKETKYHLTGNKNRFQPVQEISLLDVEDKIFFSILAKRLTKFLKINRYIDTSVEKGGIAIIPDCLELTIVVSQQPREGKENRGNLVNLWLDLANAYCSLLHKIKYLLFEDVQ